MLYWYIQLFVIQFYARTTLYAGNLYVSEKQVYQAQARLSHIEEKKQIGR